MNHDFQLENMNDQLDQQIAMEINKIRDDVNESRRRLGIVRVEYRRETAGAIYSAQ
jgi:hypothetical protein